MPAKLRIEKHRINSADFGSESPLPPLHPPVSFACGMKIGDSVPSQSRKYLGYGLDTGCLPYGLQDGYSRVRRMSEMKVAVLAGEEKDNVKAAELYREAIKMAPAVMPLMIEGIRAWLEAGWNEEVLDFIRTQPQSIREHGRMKTLEAYALMELGKLDEAESILAAGLEVAELREGEIALSDLWYSIQERKLSGKLGCPADEQLKKRVRREFILPVQLDFRMTE